MQVSADSMPMPEIAARRLAEEPLDRGAGLERAQVTEPLEDRERPAAPSRHHQRPRRASPGAGGELAWARGHGHAAIVPVVQAGVSVRPPASPAVDAHGGAVDDLAAEQHPGQRVADRRLDQAAQRPGAVRRVVAGVGQPLARGVGDLDVDPPGRQPLLEQRELEVDDVRQVVLRERVEDDDLVEPVEELRLERLPAPSPAPTRASPRPGPASGRPGTPSRGCWSGSAACCGSRPCGPGRR